MIPKFNLEFILHAKDSTAAKIQSALAEFGSGLTVTHLANEAGNSDYDVRMVTEDPTLVFDLCSQFGRIRSVRVGEAEDAKN